MNAHRLWQLISPALPVGAYSYSQGLEYAVEAGWVSDEQSTQSWIGGIAQQVLGQQELPTLVRIIDAWATDDAPTARHWNSELLARRESRELLDEDLVMGGSLRRLAEGLDLPMPEALCECARPGYLFVYGWLCQHWGISTDDALGGYLWSWLENQVTAAIKLVPLGQTAGQRVLLHLADAIPATVEQARQVADDEIGFTAPGLAVASGLHETQFTRLFRS